METIKDNGKCQNKSNGNILILKIVKFPIKLSIVKFIIKKLQNSYSIIKVWQDKKTMFTKLILTLF